LWMDKGGTHKQYRREWRSWWTKCNSQSTVLEKLCKINNWDDRRLFGRRKEYNCVHPPIMMAALTQAVIDDQYW
jgi:hypothetical protein